MPVPLTLITDSLNPRRGGAELYLAELARRAVALGHPLRIYTRRLDGVPALPEVPRLPLPPAWRRGVPALGGPVLATLALPGVTHYQPHSGLLRDGFAAERESFGPGLRRWAYPLGNFFNSGRRRRVAEQERLLGGPAPPWVMTFSQGMRRHLLGRFGLAPERVRCAPLGVDLDLFLPGRGPALEPIPDLAPPPPAGRLVLLFSAHNFRLKGLYDLFEALAQALAQGLDAELLVAGAGNRGEARRQAVRCGVAGRVRLLGALARSDMSRLYRACDLLVHPSYSDHSSLAVLEALASGRPVITSARDGAAEWLQQGVQGWILARPGDPAALAAALLTLGNRARLTAMGEAASRLRPRLDFLVQMDQVLDWLASPQPGQRDEGGDG